MKPLVLFIFLLVSHSCKEYNKDGINKFIKRIAKIKEGTKIYELRTDSLGNIIDTISTTIIKVDGSGKKIFEEIIYNKEDRIVIQNYFSDNLVYSKSSSEKFGILSTFEAIEENGKIVRVVNSNYSNNQITISTNMSYNYVYDQNEKLNELIITAEDTIGSTQSHTIYNEFENPAATFTIIDGVKEQEEIFEYNENNVLTKKIILLYKKDLKNIIEYNDNGFMKQETIYSIKEDTSSPYIISYYETNEKGDILRKKTVIKNLNKTEYFIYKYLPFRESTTSGS